MAGIYGLARNPIQGRPRSIHSSAQHHLRLCSLLCPTTDGSMLLLSDKKVTLLHCAFWVRGLLGHPKRQEAGLQQVYRCVTRLFLSLITNCGRIWSDVRFCCMEDPSPSSSSHTGANQGQFPTNVAQWVLCCTSYIFAVLSHHTFEGQRHHEPWRRLLLMGWDCTSGQCVQRFQRCGTSSPHPGRWASMLLKHTFNEWNSTSAGGGVSVLLISATEGRASYTNHHPWSWFSGVGCLVLSIKERVNIILSSNSIQGGSGCFISLNK